MSDHCQRCGAAGMRYHTHVCNVGGVAAVLPSARRYQTCPKCNGQKIVNTPPWVGGDQESYLGGNTGTYQCPVCRGLGMVEEPRGA